MTLDNLRHRLTVIDVLGRCEGVYLWVVRDPRHAERCARAAEVLGWDRYSDGTLRCGVAKVTLVPVTSQYLGRGVRLRGWTNSCPVPLDLLEMIASQCIGATS